MKEESKIPSRRIRRALALVVTACAMVVICSVAGAAPDPGGPTRSTDEKLDLKRYVAAGDRAYVIGSEDGRFPPMGWHIRGELGGVWAHPIKLLGKRYTTEVSAPPGWNLTIGHTLPAGTTVKTATLDGNSTSYDVVDTTRGARSA